MTENDVTNHRMMGLLIGKGLIANAYVGISGGNRKVGTGLAVLGFLITRSAYVILYKSYHARGYLEYLGLAAKAGTLRDFQFPLLGWSRKRWKGWRMGFWRCPWLGKGAISWSPACSFPRC